MVAVAQWQSTSLWPKGLRVQIPSATHFFLKMKLIFAKNLGFCSGVKRAILITKTALKDDKKPVQFLGSLVHNELVIDKFLKKGIKFRKKMKEAEPGTLIIQAHGTSPFNAKNKDVVIRDTTCPLVKKVQLAAQALHEKGFQVIIIGDKNHSETKGIKGYTKNTAKIVANEKEAEKLPKSKKLGVICQTTQSLNDIKNILRILKKKAKEIKFVNTLCPEIRNRQKELEAIIGRVDAVLVLGSEMSANTRRLTQKAKKLKRKAFRINSLKELKEINLSGISSLGIVSGASTPDWEIKKMKKWLKEKKQK